MGSVEVSALDLLIVTLACWRMAHLLVRESGPFAVMERLRRLTTLGGMLNCIACASVWTGLLAWALWTAGGEIGRGVVLVAAVSAGALMVASWSGVHHDR